MQGKSLVSIKHVKFSLHCFRDITLKINVTKLGFLLNLPCLTHIQATSNIKAHKRWGFLTYKGFRTNWNLLKYETTSPIEDASHIEADSYIDYIEAASQFYVTFQNEVLYYDFKIDIQFWLHYFDKNAWIFSNLVPHFWGDDSSGMPVVTATICDSGRASLRLI